MKKIVVLLLSLTIGIGVFSPTTAKSVSLSVKDIAKKDKYTFLVCGVDNAAENTDAIILFNYDVSKNIGAFLQIPRDTYLSYGDVTDKINSIYPAIRQMGKSSDEAMQALCTAISDSFGIRIDGYMSYTIDAMRRLIDGIGGVDIDIPYDFSFSDPDGDNHLELKKGTHHLDGEEAIKFIRYRSGYALGDLGRVDAQKFFLSAFVKKLKNSINFKLVCKSAFKSSEGFATNLKLMDILGIAFKMRGRISNADVKYANATGVARQMKNGRWYYFINSPSCAELMREMNFYITDDFDREKRMLNSDTEELIDLYYNENTSLRILDDSELNRIDIKD